MYLYKTEITILYLMLLLCRSNARPWEIQQETTEYSGTIVPFIMRELDSFTATLFSQPQVPLVGAGAALAYLGYVGFEMLTSETKLHSARARSDNTSSDLFSGLASDYVYEALEQSQSAAAFRQAGARSLQHGSAILRRGLNAFTRAVGFLYSTLTVSQRALTTNCIAERLCRVGQLTGTRWPILGVLLRSLDSPVLDEYARALIDGTTIGDCGAIYPNCPE